MAEPAHQLDPYEEAAFRAAVQEGLDDLAAGRSVLWKDVRRWTDSWWTPNELPPPGCPQPYTFASLEGFHLAAVLG